MAHEVFYEIDIHVFGEHFTSLTVKSKENHSPVVTAYWPASLEQNGPICELSAGFYIYKSISTSTVALHSFAN